jgi:catechol 2,3-dioxygenase-like lactoylglutathione lyase family enzyme
MLNHVTIGVTDLDRATQFYDELLDIIGARELWSTPDMRMYGAGSDVPKVAVCTPFNGQPQNPGNGNMIAFKGGSKEGVDQLYAKAIKLGATDEGKPGERQHHSRYYAAYIRDLDGNKLCFIHAYI